MDNQEPSRTNYPEQNGKLQRLLIAEKVNSKTLICVYNNGQELFFAEELPNTDYDQEAVVTVQQLILACNALDHYDQVQQLANTKPATNLSKTWRYWYPLKSLLHSATLKISLNYVRPFYDSQKFKISPYAGA